MPYVLQAVRMMAQLRAEEPDVTRRYVRIARELFGGLYVKNGQVHQSVLLLCAMR
jgi:hypothetical protein